MILDLTEYYTIVDLEENEKYYIRVKSKNIYGESGYYEVREAIIPTKRIYNYYYYINRSTRFTISFTSRKYKFDN